MIGKYIFVEEVKNQLWITVYQNGKPIRLHSNVLERELPKSDL